MKKIALLVMIALVFTLSGCQSKAPVSRTIKNGDKAPDENLQEDGSTSKSTNELVLSLDAASKPESIQQPGSADESAPETEDASGQADSGDLIEIREKMFVAQTNDVYFNTEDYLGKTLKYEGIFSKYDDPQTGVTYYSVIRYGPGCCGVDANAGFEVMWDYDAEYPKENDWVEAIGVLEEYEEEGYQYLRLKLKSLTVLDTRGAEYVSQ